MHTVLNASARLSTPPCVGDGAAGRRGGGGGATQGPCGCCKSILGQNEVYAVRRKPCAPCVLSVRAVQAEMLVRHLWLELHVWYQQCKQQSKEQAMQARIQAATNAASNLRANAAHDATNAARIKTTNVYMHWLFVVLVVAVFCCVVCCIDSYIACCIVCCLDSCLHYFSCSMHRLRPVIRQTHCVVSLCYNSRVAWLF